MKLLDLFIFSISNLKRNKMRTILTVSGVVVGIGAIVFLVSLGFGLQNLVINEIASMESLTIIEVQPKKSDLNNEAVEEFKKIKGVKHVSPSYQVSGQTKLDHTKSDVSVFAIDPAYMKTEEIKVDVGKKLSSKNAKEIILSRSALKVFDIEEASSIIGKKVQLLIYLTKEGKQIKPKTDEQKPFLKVVGIIKGQKESVAYIPLDIISDLDSGDYTTIKVKTENREVLKEIKKKINEMGYGATSVKDTISEVNAIFRWVQVVLAAFGTIALFVASIGIFNTMTIALLERTHEIGVMKAIGATNKDIRRMFVFEAAQIGLWGGALGLFGGWLSGQGINLIANVLAKQFGGASQSLFFIPPWFSIMSVIFSLLVSLLAGIYPARRAGKLNPIEALRYE